MIILFLLISYMIFIGFYFVFRYGGRWSENDSAVLTRATASVYSEGRLVPVSEDALVYPNGYAYQAISTYVIGVTGLDVIALQQVYYPVFAALLVLPAWLLYRELIGDVRRVALAVILLFTQPEFLFVILRSSHEKFTRMFMMLCLYFLVRSFSLSDRPWLLAMHVGLFYLSIAALIASNNLLAHSFLASVAIALVLGWILELRNPRLRDLDGRILRRFAYVMFISLCLVYIYMFYVYSPAEENIFILRTIWDRIAALLLDVQTQSNNSYAQVQAGWVSLPVYFIVSIANWLVLFASFVIWCSQGFHWIWHRKAPQSRGAWLTWLLYTSLATQGMLSVAVDASGALGSNLQHRLFPSFSMIAVAMVGTAIADWQPQRFARAAWLGLTNVIFCVAILSVLKATNEPLLSNKWTFYHSNELAAIDWTDAHMYNAQVWTEIDDRLSSMYLAIRGSSANNNQFRGFVVRPSIRALLVTDVTRLRSLRLKQPLPIPPDALQVYDNGGAQLYRLRPQTPYQR